MVSAKLFRRRHLRMASFDVAKVLQKESDLADRPFLKRLECGW